MYTITDLKKKYGVTEHTILAWIRSGELKAINVGRTPKAKLPRWRVSQDALDAFEAIRTPSPSESQVRRRKKRTDEVTEYIK